MQITLQHITIRDLYYQYKDDLENGITGFGGKLNIRPAYQREFIYNDKQQKAVIDTIQKNLPLNVFYWVKNNDTSFELLDGQQRTISICSFIDSNFEVNFQFFHNLDAAEQKQIMDYELMVYICEGTDADKLSWFKTINIAGAKLTEQELRNAIYTGPWLTDAKKYFSKTGCAAYAIASDYMKGTPIRQDYLQTVIQWANDGNIESYMATHQHDTDATALWLYFQNIITWVETTFPNYRKEMKGLPWGPLFDAHKTDTLDPKQLEQQILALMLDEDVTKKAGIYPYLLTGDEKHLNIRAFSPKQKREQFTAQQGLCPSCGDTFSIADMEADHIDPWKDGGKTELTNCQMLCKACNRRKGSK